MAYTKQQWVDGPGGGTPMSAARLGHIEDGIGAAHDLASGQLSVTQITGSAILTGTWQGWAIEVNSASPITLSLPADSTYNYPVGTVLGPITQVGAGTVTISGEAGTVLQTADTLVIRKQWCSAYARKRAANTWIVEGDLS